MRVVIQRVTRASVTIDNEIYSSIGLGLFVLVGIEDADNEEDAQWLAGKIAKIRIFSDQEGLMNCALQDVDGQILVVSQFTLHAATKKGNRPSFIKAARPETAIPLYEKFIQYIENESNTKVKTGVFGADMKIDLLNDGPVTIIIDSKNRE
jgi:D-tyrosyl-tRNA(Tyr) deacylase